MSDDRAQKARERIEHFMAQRVGDGEEKVERDDPQTNEPNTAQQNATEGAGRRTHASRELRDR